MAARSCISWLPVAALAAVGLSASTGCVSAPYSYGKTADYQTSPELRAATKVQIERGEPRPFVDGVGWVLGIPSKIVLWDRRIDNHDVSSDTEAAIAEYLAVNELDSVKVRLNQYAPADEWNRLVANKSVAWGWRYSLGTLNWVRYTLLPGRIFGGDEFNPFSNTIHIYSDAPAVALHEAGHAKDWAYRTYKGTYAALYLVPGAPLWHEAVASNDAMSYLHARGGPTGEREGYELLYPAYGTYLGAAAGDLLPGVGLLGYGAGVIGGHVVGRLKARQASHLAPVANAAPQESLPVLPPHETVPDDRTLSIPERLPAVKEGPTHPDPGQQRP